MANMTLKDLAARRKSLALGLEAVESVQLLAQLDLIEALRAEVMTLQGRYSGTGDNTCPWVLRQAVVHLLNRALEEK